MKCPPARSGIWVTSSLRVPAARAALLAACAALGACSGTPAEPHGSPVLLKVYWSANGAQQLVWSRPDDPDTSLVSHVPPFGSEIDFVFDRLLDGSRIEDVITVDGVQMTRPKDPPAVNATWSDMAANPTTPPFSLTVSYNSVPRYGVGTSYVFARPETPGFPAGALVSLSFVPAQLTSVYGEPATLPDSIPVLTDPLGVSIGGSSSAIATSFPIPLAFTNRLPAPPAQNPFIHVTANGAAVPYKLLSDANLSSRWFLAPADCLGGAWPGATTLTVTIDVGFTDAFGSKLPAAATAMFTTMAGTGAATGAACAATDGGAPDASDGGGLDSAVLDAEAVDGGVDAAPDASADAAGD